VSSGAVYLRAVLLILSFWNKSLQHRYSWGHRSCLDALPGPSCAHPGLQHVSPARIQDRVLYGLIKSHHGDYTHGDDDAHAERRDRGTDLPATARGNRTRSRAAGSSATGSITGSSCSSGAEYCAYASADALDHAVSSSPGGSFRLKPAAPPSSWVCPADSGSSNRSWFCWWGSHARSCLCSRNTRPETSPN
jgi:hypothetical protein